METRLDGSLYIFGSDLWSDALFGSGGVLVNFLAPYPLVFFLSHSSIFDRSNSIASILREPRPTLYDKAFENANDSTVNLLAWVTILYKLLRVLELRRGKSMSKSCFFDSKTILADMQVGCMKRARTVRRIGKTVETDKPSATSNRAHPVFKMTGSPRSAPSYSVQIQGSIRNLIRPVTGSSRSRTAE